MNKMIEKAKEELELLEYHHPDGFDFLKLELNSFISFLQSQQIDGPLPATSTATTQASTSMKRKRLCVKRRKLNDDQWDIKDDIKCSVEHTKMMKQQQRDRVDVVLQKAQACLRKIQDVKVSLIC